MSEARPIIFAALVVGLVCRLAFAFGYWNEKPLTRDEREYLDLAYQAANGNGLRYAGDGTERFSRAPLYPLFIAAVLRVSHGAQKDVTSTPAALKIAQSALGVLSVWLIALIAAHLAGPRAAALAASIAAVYPPLVWISAYVFSEALYITVALASVVSLGYPIDTESNDRTRMRWIALAGVLCGFTALTRPAHLVFVACACLWLCSRRMFASAVVLFVTTMIVILPWTIRNYREHGRLILIAAEGGVTFWTGNHPLARGEGDLAANPQLKIADLEFRRAHPGLTAEQLEPLYYRAALEWIAARPFDWIALAARKFFYTWAPIGPSYRLHSSRYFLASVLSYGVLLPLGVAGAWRLRQHTVQPRALALFAASGVLTALIFMPQERFRISVIDPALIVCAGALAKKTPDVFLRQSENEV